MGSFFGLETLIENASNLAGTGEAVSERKRKDAIEDYKTHEREGIIARVEGAKAAGLHPLAALGFQAGPSPAMPVGSQVQSFGRPNTKDTSALEAAQIRLLSAQADEAEANARRSNQVLAGQPGNAPPESGIGLPTESENLTAGGKPIRGVKIVPNEIEASAKGVTIGKHPGATVIKVPGYGEMTVPSKKASEGMEDLDALKTLYTIGLNRNRLLEFLKEDIPWATRGYLEDAMRAINAASPKLGKAPSFRRDRGTPRRKGGATGSW